MVTLTRPQFCAVTEVDHVTLGNMIRRGQTPFAVDQKASGRGYSIFEAYLMLLARTLVRVHHIELIRSAEIAGSLPAVLQLAWQEIGRTGKLLAGGTDRPVVEIMCGRVERAGQLPVAICGTDRAIDKDVRALGGGVLGSVRISASHQAAELIQRAQRHAVEIPSEFWSAPLMYRPRPSTTPAEFAALAEAGAR